MSNKLNVFFKNLASDIKMWRVRILMGDTNMGNYAVEEALEAHQLLANILACHAEFVNERDVSLEC